MGETLFHVVCPDCAAEYVGTDRDDAWALFEDHSQRFHGVRLQTMDAETATDRKVAEGTPTSAVP